MVYYPSKGGSRVNRHYTMGMGWRKPGKGVLASSLLPLLPLSQDISVKTLHAQNATCNSHMCTNANLEFNSCGCTDVVESNAPHQIVSAATIMLCEILRTIRVHYSIHVNNL